MTDYAFLSTWVLSDVSLPEAFAQLRNSVEYPRWWRGVESARVVARGGPDGVGDVIECTWRGRLPYRLNFELELTRIDPPYLIQAAARGDLEGTGTWRLYAGREVAIVFEWHVATTKRWMRVVAPLARPAFVWNHDIVMREGARGLASRLRGALVTCD